MDAMAQAWGAGKGFGGASAPEADDEDEAPGGGDDLDEIKSQLAELQAKLSKMGK